VDENTRVQLVLATAIIGLLKVILEILKLFLEWSEKRKTHPNRQRRKTKRKR
jgi:hypothetical protein